MKDEQGASPTGEAPAAEPRSAAQTPAEAVYDQVMLAWFEDESIKTGRPSQELVAEAAVKLLGYPTHAQLGLAAAFLLMVTVERDGLLEVVARGMTSTLYTVMVNDRHKDPEAKVFTTKEAAIAYARDVAEGMGLVDDHIDEWLYYASHKTEDDAVWVVETELNQGESS